MVENKDYGAYQYMKSGGCRVVTEDEMERHEQMVKRELFPKLKEAQQKKELGAWKVSAFLLD